MLETLLSWDHILFDLINQSLTNSFLDTVLPIMRNKYVWVPFYIFLIAYFNINYGLKGLAISLMVVITITISDQTSSSLIKESVERLRPCKQEGIAEEARLLIEHCGAGYSFTSSHATNHFALAGFLATLLGVRWRWVSAAVLIWAFVVSYAQVYVGVHFPFDVLSGGILGFIIGKVMATITGTVLAFEP